ncbi:MAG: hypothetical protein DCO96_13785 [Fluviicola sp. XM-24bin1]|nr:MAG: hypothetical protein DCO96_13785 [Fluviicola sp. XM-24bin1]
MKKRNIFYSALFVFATGLSFGQATVQDAVNPDVPIWGQVDNTGIAIAPFYQWNAVVHNSG